MLNKNNAEVREKSQGGVSGFLLGIVKFMYFKILEQLPLFLLVIAVFSLVVLSGFISSERILEESNIYLTIAVIEILVFVMPAMIFTRFRGMDFIRQTNISLPALTKLPFVFFMLIVLITSNILITIGIYEGIAPDTSGVSGITLPENVDKIDIIGVLVSLTLIPAICEEYVFRCVILSELKKYGYLCAILISAFLFALVHFDQAGFFIYFLSGIMLGFTAYVTRSVGASIILHFAYNIYSLFLEGSVWRILSKNVNIILILFIIVVALLISLMVVFLEASRIFLDYSLMNIKPPESYVNKNKVENAEEKIIQNRKAALGAFVCPAVIAAVAIYIFVLTVF